MTRRILNKLQSGELDAAMAMQLLGKGSDAGSAGLPQKRPLEPTNAPVKDPEQDEFDKLVDDAKKAKNDTLLNCCFFFVICCPFISRTIGNHWGT